jgi:manganese/iron transport system permease protein
MAPFQYPFMTDALYVGLFVAFLCALYSCLLILKGWSLMGDALSHAILPGIVIAHWLNIPIQIGAFGAGIFCSYAAVEIKNRTKVKEDTSLGIVFTGMFALGLVLFTKTHSALHLDHILFGNILGLVPSDRLEIFSLGSAGLILFFIFHKNILLTIFDPTFAKGIGIKIKAYQYLLLGLVTLTIISALKAVGIILVIAMLITPGSIGFLISKNFYKMAAIACAVACVSTLVGIYLSFYWNSSPAATIVLVQSIFFIFAAGVNRWKTSF